MLTVQTKPFLFNILLTLGRTWYCYILGLQCKCGRNREAYLERHSLKHGSSSVTRFFTSVRVINDFPSLSRFLQCWEIIGGCLAEILVTCFSRHLFWASVDFCSHVHNTFFLIVFDTTKKTILPIQNLDSPCCLVSWEKVLNLNNLSDFFHSLSCSSSSWLPPTNTRGSGPPSWSWRCLFFIYLSLWQLELTFGWVFLSLVYRIGF